MSEKTQPLVSVIIPSYNHSLYISTCIRSIIHQSYRRLELIIIDDGSTDTSVNVIQSLLPECLSRFVRFDFIKRENRGLIATLNQAILWCRGDFYCAIASDDYFLPEKIRHQVNYLIDTPKAVAIFGGAEIVNEFGEVDRIYKPTSECISFSDLFLMRRSVIAATGMVRMNAMKAIGFIPSDLRIEDWYTWLKLTEGGATIKVSSTRYVGYRRHSSNFSSNLEVMARERLKVLDLFSKHTYYDLAKAQCYLLSAAEYWSVDRKKSLAMLRYAFLVDIRVLYSKRFFMHLLRMLVPDFLRGRLC